MKSFLIVIMHLALRFIIILFKYLFSLPSHSRSYLAQV